MTVEAPSGPVFFNPFDPAFRVDPYPVYKRLRDEDPVHQTPIGGLALSRYDDCVAVLRSPRTSSDFRNSDLYEAFAAQRGAPPPEIEALRPFLFLDPPDHTRLRGLVQKAFTARVVEELRPRVQELVDQLLDDVAEQGEMDVIADLAYPLPVRIISEMLGVPPEDHETFKGWSAVLAS